MSAPSGCGEHAQLSTERALFLFEALPLVPVHEETPKTTWLCLSAFLAGTPGWRYGTTTSRKTEHLFVSICPFHQGRCGSVRPFFVFVLDKSVSYLWPELYCCNLVLNAGEGNTMCNSSVSKTHPKPIPILHFHGQHLSAHCSLSPG